MPLLPYDTLLIESPLPLHEARARLQGATGPVRWLRFGAPPHAFEGEVAGDAVRIHRAIRYQNAFLPRIEGRLEPGAQGSRLRAAMKLHPFVAVFMAVWFSIALAAGLPMVIALFFGAPAVTALIPLAMLLFGGALVSGAFTFEARIARERLAALLDGHTPADARDARTAA